jgi:hypothetical protein
MADAQEIRSFLKRFPVVWGVFTAAYAFTVIYRAAAFGLWPSLPSLAACLAITAVWMDILQLTRGSIRLRLAVAALVLMTLVTNAALAVIAILGGKGFPGGRLILTVFFSLILHERLTDIAAHKSEMME